MKHLSFKWLILGILFPPVLYTLTIGSMEARLQRFYAREIERIYLGEVQPLLNGSIGLRDAIDENIHRYLKSKPLFVRLGIRTTVMVATRGGTILYPAALYDDEAESIHQDPMNTARENFDLMNEGLLISSDAKIGHGSILSISVFAFFILTSISFLYYHHRKGMKKARLDEVETTRKIDRLLHTENKLARELEARIREREELNLEFESLSEKLNCEKQKADATQEEWIGEMIGLEERLKTNLELQEKQQNEIEIFKEQIGNYEKDKSRIKMQKNKSKDSVQKRFKALYKKVSISERALEGFLDLTEEMKIKCEEIIHQLNDEPAAVSIKRKIFGKKNRETVLEVVFSYNGRLYFRNNPGSRLEVLVVGTKHSQERDLEFLNSL